MNPNVAKVLKILGAELRGYLQWVVMYFPNTHLGVRIRRWYWGARLKNYTLWYMGYAANIQGCDLLDLGARFVLSDYATLEIADSDPVYIGTNVAMANGSYLRSANHRFDDLSVPIQSQGYSSKRIEYKGRCYSIVIEDNVWLGAKSIVLTGAFIGEGSVVSAGSVVSSEIPPFSVVVGNPGRVIANRKKLTELKQAGSGNIA